MNSLIYITIIYFQHIFNGVITYVLLVVDNNILV